MRPDVVVVLAPRVGGAAGFEDRRECVEVQQFSVGLGFLNSESPVLK